MRKKIILVLMPILLVGLLVGCSKSASSLIEEYAVAKENAIKQSLEYFGMVLSGRMTEEETATVEAELTILEAELDAMESEINALELTEEQQSAYDVAKNPSF